METKKTDQLIDKWVIPLDDKDPWKIWAMGKTWQEVYDTCNDGEFLVWLYDQTLGIKRKEYESSPFPHHTLEFARVWMVIKLKLRKLTLIRGEALETVIHLMKIEDLRNVIKVTVEYGNYESCEEELRNAYHQACTTMSKLSHSGDLVKFPDSHVTYISSYTPTALYSAPCLITCDQDNTWNDVLNLIKKKIVDGFHQHLPLKEWNI